MEIIQVITAYGLETRTWTFNEKNQEYGCAECCTGDRCDEDCTAKYKGRRKDCPHCKGNGWIPKGAVTTHNREIKYKGVWTPKYMAERIHSSMHGTDIMNIEKALSAWAADIVEVNGSTPTDKWGSATLNISGDIVKISKNLVKIKDYLPPNCANLRDDLIIEIAHLADIILNISKIRVSKKEEWINVNDQLPELKDKQDWKGVDVLGCDKDKHILKCNFSNSGWREVSTFGSSSIVEICYWKPLPELPEFKPE